VGAVVSIDAGPLAELFPRQRDVVLSKAKFKALLCGRRAGKTECAIRDLAHGMMTDPGSANLYVALTIGSAVKIFWKPFRVLNDKHGWGFRFNESTHEIRHPNGAWLVVAGGDSRADLEKYRGTPWKRVRVDECGAWRPSYLGYFIEEVIEPSFMDFDGDCWLMGTPTKQAFGYFYEATTGKRGYHVFHWTAEDNPHVRWQSFVFDPVEGLLARRGWTVDNAIFKREYLALWSVDASELVYAYDRLRTVVDALPAHPPGWDYVVGFDFGVNNASAYSVIASPRGYGNTIYTVECFRQSGLAPSQFAPIMNDVLTRYEPWKAVGDSGGLGKAYLAEYAVRHGEGWAIVPANKQDRRGTIEIVSDMLLTGRKRSLACNTALHDEWSTLQWDEDRENTAEGQDNDVSDADMYATKECPAFMQRATEEPPDSDDPPHVHADEMEDEPQRSYLDL
jgi:hypothetical protein